VGVRALSLVDDRSEHFNLAARGYDRAEVDAFLERTAADRIRLKADLAQLEAAIADHDLAHRQELERLTALRREVARCLETSINALHVANLLMSAPAARPEATPAPEAPSDEQPDAIVEPGPAPVVESAVPSPTSTQAAWPLPSWLSPARTVAAIAIVLAGVATVQLLGDTRAATPGPVVSVSLAGVPIGEPFVPASTSIELALPGEPEPLPAPADPDRIAEGDSPLATPSAPSERSGQAPAVADSLVLTLTAVGDCWIRTTMDGGEPRERLLKANETVTLRAADEAVLRVGDPAALLLTINDRPAKTLGAAGRVVTARITSANYLDFLDGR